MMRRIVSASLRFRFLVVAVAVGMVFFGAAQLRQMPVDVFPEFAPPRVEIQTLALGMSAAEVESLVTIPLEQALSGSRASTSFVRSPPPGLGDRADLQVGHRSAARPAARHRTDVGGDRDAADLGRSRS